MAELAHVDDGGDKLVVVDGATAVHVSGIHEVPDPPWAGLSCGAVGPPSARRRWMAFLATMSMALNISLSPVGSFITGKLEDVECS
jgi:hypothetical protein